MGVCDGVCDGSFVEWEMWEGLGYEVVFGVVLRIVLVKRSVLFLCITLNLGTADWFGLEGCRLIRFICSFLQGLGFGCSCCLPKKIF